MNWKTAYLETRVLSADPVELIGILYEYAVMSVQDARNGLAQGNIPDRSKAIAKVIAILGELESSLDHKLGGEIALNLGRLYRYMRERLTSANLRQVDEPLAEVEALLKTLGEAWQAIGADKATQHDDAGSSMAHADWAPPLTDAMPDFVSHSWSA
jgi:flagellar protein FliS